MPGRFEARIAPLSGLGNGKSHQWLIASERESYDALWSTRLPPRNPGADLRSARNPLRAQLHLREAATPNPNAQCAQALVVSGSVIFLNRTLWCVRRSWRVPA